MGLSSALGAALSGLKTTQRGLDLVATNVANSQTAGYTRKSLVVEPTVTGGVTSGVRVSDVRREIDLYLQKQLRTETSGAAYASQRAATLNGLQTIFGTPGGALSLDTSVNNFSTALDALVTSPDDQNARSSVIAQARALAQSLNNASRDVQSLRSDADAKISDGVDAANDALTSIETLTEQIKEAAARGQPTGDLEDVRDMAIDTLSGLMDIKVEDLGAGDIRIKTGAVTLFDEAGAASFSFEAAGSVTSDMSYQDGSLSGVIVTRPSGQSVDLLEAGRLRSGSLKALAELRDTTLPQTQDQLDEMAANLAQALGTNVTAGAKIAGGVDLSTDGALAGDRLTVSYTSGGVTRSVTIVNVGDPTKLPLGDDLTSDPNDVVIGVDFNSPTAAADIDAALSAKGVAIDVSQSADGFAFVSGGPAVEITGGQSRITATALSGDGLALPVFTDAGGEPYSGSLDGGDQRSGFAGRITVNAELVSDPAKLSAYAASTAAGDTARPEFLRDALKGDRSFALDSGLGSTSKPFTGSIAEFAQGIISMQARQSASATRVSEGQSMVVTTLTDKYSEASGVDVDQEMSNLIQLQTAYGANARVVTAVKEMMDMLMRM